MSSDRSDVRPPRTNDRPRLLTTEDASEYLTVSVRTMKKLLSDGLLPFVKIGRVTRIDARDLDEYLSRNRRRNRRPLRDVK